MIPEDVKREARKVYIANDLMRKAQILYDIQEGMLLCDGIPEICVLKKSTLAAYIEERSSNCDSFQRNAFCEFERTTSRCSTPGTQGVVQRLGWGKDVRCNNAPLTRDVNRAKAQEFR